MADGITTEKLSELVDELDIARSTVFVSAAALDHGESDLELQSATALKKAFEMMDEVYNELVAIHNQSYRPRRPKGTAAVVLSNLEETEHD